MDRKTGFVIPLISFLFIQGAIHVADARSEARGLFSVRVQWRAKPSLRRGEFGPSIPTIRHFLSLLLSNDVAEICGSR